MQFLLVFAMVVAMTMAASPFSRPPLRTPFRQVAPVQQAFASARTFAPAQPAFARASSSDQNANTVRFDFDTNPDGNYNYAYETDNGISAQENGQPRNLGGNPPNIPVVAQGAYSYTSPEGQQVSISYVADENGFQPSGDAIPQPPPIPPAIARALEFIARNPPSQ